MQILSTQAETIELTRIISQICECHLAAGGQCVYHDWIFDPNVAAHLLFSRRIADKLRAEEWAA
jgi:hypothetical protein